MIPYSNAHITIRFYTFFCKTGTCKNIIFPQKKVADKIVEGGRNLSVNTMGGGLGGAVVGGILGGALTLITGNPMFVVSGIGIGGSVGGGLGVAKGIKETLGNNQADVNVVKNTLSKYINDTGADVVNKFSKNNLYLKKTVTEMFDAEIKNCVAEVNEERTRLKKNIEISKEDLPKLQETLKKNVSIVKALSKAADDLGGKMTKYKAVKHENVTVKANDLRTKESNKSEVKYDFL